MLSYWEKSEFIVYDLIIVGGGIMGTNVALSVLEKYPDKKVLILERGILPTGATTKNVGFLCLVDLAEAVRGKTKYVEVSERYKGINHYINNFDHSKIDLEFKGRFELFEEKDKHIVEYIDQVNKQFYEIFKDNLFRKLSTEEIRQLGINTDVIKAAAYNKYEISVNSGKLIKEMVRKVYISGGTYLTGAQVINFKETQNDGNSYYSVEVKNPMGEYENINFLTEKLIFCNNGFTKQFEKFQHLDMGPSRGQVFVTKPIKDLKLIGNFTVNEDPFYFRNYQDRIIFGGGKLLEFNKSNVLKFENNLNQLEISKSALKNIFMIDQDFEIDYAWSGILAYCVSDQDNYNPILEKIDKNLYVTCRYCGNGMSISPYIGKIATDLMFGDYHEGVEKYKQIFLQKQASL